MKSAEYKFRAKLDLKLGFNTVVLSASSRSLLGFYYKGQFYSYQVMPLGITNGPQIFDSWGLSCVKFIRPLLPPSISLDYYQDDFVVSGNVEIVINKSTTSSYKVSGTFFIAPILMRNFVIACLALSTV